MRLLFDLGHPAHVHLFRHLIARVRAHGGEVLVTARDKDVTVGLCHQYGIPVTVLSHAHGGDLLSTMRELLIRTVGVLRCAWKFRPDALVGTSISIGPVGRAIGRPSFVFNEDDARVVPLFAKIAYPAATYVVTPECLKHEAHGEKHLTYRGYHELSYLHPDHFTPDRTVLNELGVKPYEPFFILRCVALKAHHDQGAQGLSADLATALVEVLSHYGRVWVTAEQFTKNPLSGRRFPLPPSLFHDALAFCSLCITDSQTVAAEAAVLGVPNIRVNTFVGRITYLEELERRYGLTCGFRPHEFRKALLHIRNILENLDEIKRDLQNKREAMLRECVNMADWQWDMIQDRLSCH
ncbi:MAG: DUF354 domain-containing protein [Deltaproteobacteria bacterium]|nr:DUF354 domain-containing protein [Deltaproteobacteria bacterium]